MRYLCFGYLDLENWANKTETEQQAMIDACFAYDAVLKRNGNWIGGEGLQGPNTAVTLRHRNGSVQCADGPYAETKELLGGLLILEATDINHAIQLISNHPGIKMGPWEIRPAEDLSAMMAESEKRRLMTGAESKQ